MRGIKKSVLEYVLSYIYSGEVRIFQEHLIDFLTVAQDLKLKGLINVVNDTKENLKNSLSSNLMPPKTNSQNLVPCPQTSVEDSFDASEKPSVSELIDSELNSELLNGDFEATVNCVRSLLPHPGITTVNS